MTVILGCEKPRCTVTTSRLSSEGLCPRFMAPQCQDGTLPLSRAPAVLAAWRFVFSLCRLDFTDPKPFSLSPLKAQHHPSPA